MRYRVVAVGRMKDAALRAACDGYLDRLRHYAKVEEREVKNEAGVLGVIPEGTRLVALSRRGEACTSAELAEWTARWELEGRDVALAIGGADALPDEVHNFQEQNNADHHGNPDELRELGDQDFLLDEYGEYDIPDQDPHDLGDGPDDVQSEGSQKVNSMVPRLEKMKGNPDRPPQDQRENNDKRAGNQGIDKCRLHKKERRPVQEDRIPDTENEKAAQPYRTPDNVLPPKYAHPLFSYFLDSRWNQTSTTISVAFTMRKIPTTTAAATSYCLYSMFCISS